MKISRDIPAGELPAHIGENVRSLEELTGGKQSGIVIYDEKVIICDWSGQPGLPQVTFSYDIVMGNSEAVELTGVQRVDDIRDALPGTMVLVPERRQVVAKGMDLLYDNRGDMAALFGFQPKAGAKAKLNPDGSVQKVAGVCYELEANGERLTVIAPEDWD